MITYSAAMSATRRFNVLPLQTLTVLLLASVSSIHPQPFGATTSQLSNQPQNNSASAYVDTQFVGQMNEYAIRLYKQVSEKTTRQNVVISPFLISACLSLAAMGAGGPTAEELFTGLHTVSATADSKSIVADNYRRWLAQLANESTVNVANKIYLQRGFSVKAAFNAIATDSFQSKAESVDFAQSVDAAKTMNGWVESKTNNKIKDVISPHSVDGSLRMVLVNAVHFKGTWTYKFDKMLTSKRPFWTSETESRDVPMMNIKEHFAYNNFEEHGFSALELTYGGSDMTMLLLLPNERTGLAALEEKLPSLDLPELITKMHKQEVEVFLPKFKIDFSRDLNEDLKALGMTRMFTDAAEFPDLLEESEPLKVSKVVHRAFIEVNEEGTEAAAATAMQFIPHCYDCGPWEERFEADHPFIYALMDTNKIVILIGKMTNPNRKNGK